MRCACISCLKARVSLCQYADALSLLALAAPGAWDFAIPHITPGSWDATAQMQQQQAGQDHNKADGSAAAAIANGGVQYHNNQGQPNTQLQQAWHHFLLMVQYTALAALAAVLLVDALI